MTLLMTAVLAEGAGAGALTLDVASPEGHLMTA